MVLMFHHYIKKGNQRMRVIYHIGAITVTHTHTERGRDYHFIYLVPMMFPS